MIIEDDGAQVLSLILCSSSTIFFLRRTFRNLSRRAGTKACPIADMPAIDASYKLQTKSHRPVLIPTGGFKNILFRFVTNNDGEAHSKATIRCFTISQCAPCRGSASSASNLAFSSSDCSTDSLHADASSAILSHRSSTSRIRSEIGNSRSSRSWAGTMQKK